MREGDEKDEGLPEREGSQAKSRNNKTKVKKVDSKSLNVLSPVLFPSFTITSPLVGDVFSLNFL